MATRPSPRLIDARTGRAEDQAGAGRDPAGRHSSREQDASCEWTIRLPPEPVSSATINVSGGEWRPHDPTVGLRLACCSDRPGRVQRGVHELPGGSSPSGPPPTEKGPAAATELPSPSAEPTDPTSGSSDFTWTEAGRFADEGNQLITDVSAWSGASYDRPPMVGEFIVGQAEPRIWTSPSGHAWTATRPRLAWTR